MTKCNSSQGGYDVFKPQRFPVSQIPLMGLTSNNMCLPSTQASPTVASSLFPTSHSTPTCSGSATADFSFRFLGTSLTDLDQLCPGVLIQAPPPHLPHLATTLY